MRPTIRLVIVLLSAIPASAAAVVHDFSPGQILWLGDGGQHSREALAGNTRVVAIEVKAAKAVSAG